MAKRTNGNAQTARDAIDAVRQGDEAVTAQVIGMAQHQMAAAAAAEELRQEATDDADLDEAQSVKGLIHTLERLVAFYAKPVKYTNGRTGEEKVYDVGQRAWQNILNGICFAHTRALDPADEFSLVGQRVKQQDKLQEAVRAVQNDEIGELEFQRIVERIDQIDEAVAALEMGQRIAERFYERKTGRKFERPTLAPKARKVSVSGDARQRMLAEAAARGAKVPGQVAGGDKPIDMATGSADPAMRGA